MYLFAATGKAKSLPNSIARKKPFYFLYFVSTQARPCSSDNKVLVHYYTREYTGPGRSGVCDNSCLVVAVILLDFRAHSTGGAKKDRNFQLPIGCQLGRRSWNRYNFSFTFYSRTPCRYVYTAGEASEAFHLFLSSHTKAR